MVSSELRNSSPNARVALDEEQIQCYRQDGYLVIPGIVSPREATILLDYFDQHTSGLVYPHGSKRQADAPEKRFGAIRALPFFQTVYQIAAQLFQSPTDKLSSHGLLAEIPAHYPLHSDWHQDEAYWPSSLIPNALNVWCAIDTVDADADADVESSHTGTTADIEVIPGSHHADVLEHICAETSPRHYELAVAQVPTSHSISISVPPGGIVLYHCRLLYRLAGNTSDGARRAYILTVDTPPRVVPAGRMRRWLQDLARLNAIFATTSASTASDHELSR